MVNRVKTKKLEFRDVDEYQSSNLNCERIAKDAHSAFLVKVWSNKKSEFSYLRMKLEVKPSY